MKHKNNWKYTPKPEEQFLFIHVPKTAGTTFRLVLTKHFQSEDLYPTDFHLMVNNRKYLKQHILIQNRKDILQKPLIMGHYNVRLIRHLRPGVKTIIFLREPISRIKSHIKHIMRLDPDFKDVDPNKIIEAKLEVLTNAQARILGYTKKRPNVEQVLDNLEKITFVGLTEDFASSIEKINEKFNWQLEYNQQKRNASPNEIELDISAENLARIQEKIQTEIEVYEKAKEIFYGY